jgi:guanylate kinase
MWLPTNIYNTKHIVNKHFFVGNHLILGVEWQCHTMLEDKCKQLKNMHCLPSEGGAQTSRVSSNHHHGLMQCM